MCCLEIFSEEDYQLKPEEIELVASRSTNAVTIRAGANSITECQDGGSPAVWGSMYCSVVLITEVSMVGEMVDWNQKTWTQILFLMLSNCPTLGSL